jgi:methionine biosynthesis protein MetW
MNNALERINDRFDFPHVVRWVGEEERVLDLGCGDGALLALLQKEKRTKGYGVEFESANVIACLANSVNVLQFDLERGLSGFEDDSFDRVIMLFALQTIHHTVPILKEMLRVGREAIISFPNFCYRPHREAIAAGRMPVSRHLPYQWFDSPNVRFFTIADFEALCADEGIAIHERVTFAEGAMITEDPSLNAEVALYRLGRAP